MRSKAKFFVALLFFFGTAIKSKAQDSIVRFSDLVFDKTEHVYAFKMLQDNKQLSLAFLLAPLGSINAVDTVFVSKKIAELQEVLKKKIAKKSPRQQLKIISDVVHKTAFSHYSNVNTFSSIFVNGEYNCVSSAALYALVLDGLQIPYEIRERPEHVYLVAYPNTEAFVLETTSSNGTVTYTDVFMKQYVQHMKSIGVISEEESNAGSEDALFQKYYYHSKAISMRQLIAIQYCNFGAYYSLDKRYEEATEAYAKALFISDDEINRFHLLNMLAVLFQHYHLEPDKQLQVLLRMARMPELSKDGAQMAFFRENYGYLLEKYFKDETQREKIIPFHKLLVSHTADKKLKSEFDVVYHLLVASDCYDKQAASAACLEELKLAAAIDSTNEQMQSLLFYVLIEDIRTKALIKEVKQLLATYESAFPFLKNQLRYSAMCADIQLMEIYEAFEMGEVKRAEQGIVQFKMLMTRLPDINVTQDLVEKAFGTGTMYYFKKGNTPKAKATVKEGLKYAPNNFNLKRQLSQL